MAVVVLRRGWLIMFSSSTSEEKSPLSAFSSSIVPEKWQWVLELFDEAHLPKLGLPVRWEEIQKTHTFIAVNPETNSTIDITTGIVTKHKKSPVDFIYSSKDKNPMPGTQVPAAVRYARYTEPKLNNAIVTHPSGQHLAPCIAHGDYVKVEALSADHMQAKSEIIRRQKALVKKLNDEPTFAKFVMDQEGMSKFFVKVDKTYYGTLFFYELYFNDIDNIWLICDACNRKKSTETFEWLQKQWLYGQEFLDYLGIIKDQTIITKTQDNTGLAQVAIEWFWQRHAHYISVTKKLFQDFATPIHILNKYIDHVIGTGKQKRYERLQASLDAKLLLLSSVLETPGLGMPKQLDESPHSSSDEEQRLHLVDEDDNIIHPSASQYTSAMKRVAARLSTATQQFLTEELKNTDIQTDREIKETAKVKFYDGNDEPTNKRPKI